MTATNLSLDVASAGAFANALETAVTQLNAVARSGGIFVTDNDDLSVSNASATGGGISLTAQGPLSLTGNVTATTNTVNLTSIGSASNLSLLTGKSVSGPSVTMQADRMNLAGSVQATVGAVQLNTSSVGWGIDLGSTTDTAANTLELSDAELDRIAAGVLKVGGSNAGAITISQPISPAGTSTLHLVSGAGVSQSAALSVANLALEAGGTVNLSSSNDASTLAIRTTAGNLSYSDSNGFTIGQVNGVSGVSSIAGSLGLLAFTGNILVTNTSATNDLEGGPGFSINVTLFGSDGVFSVASGAVVSGSGAQITANRVDLAGTLTATSTVTLQPSSAGRLVNLGSTTDVAVNTLELSDAELDRITAGILKVGGSNAGAITISQPIHPAGTSTLHLLTGEVILDGQATGTDVAIANLVMSSAAGIGTASDPLETLISTLQASGGSGGVFVANTGSLTLVGSGVTADRDIVVTVGSPLNVQANVLSRLGNVTLSAGESAGAGDDLTVGSGITIASQIGNVTLQAGDVVNLAAGSVVNSPMGTIVAQVGFNDTDGISVGSIAGALISPNPVTVQGGNASDSITLYASASAADFKIKGGDGNDVIVIEVSTGFGVSIDGEGGSDRFVIQLGALAGPVNVTDTTGSNTVQIVGTPGDDNLTVTATQVSAGSETITLNVVGSTSTALVIDGGGGTNQVTVESTPVGTILTGSNLAATLSSISAPLSPTAVNTPIVFNASFIDLDVADIHTAIWHWGDGRTSTGTVTETSSSMGTIGSVRDSHSYASAGVYTVKLTVTDNDGVSVSQQATAYVEGVGLIGRVLYVIGTDGKDDVAVKLGSGSNSGKLEINAKLRKGNDNVEYDSSFDVTSVDRIFMFLANDDDKVKIDKDVMVGSTLYGGAGNDKLDGGGGRDTIFGETGDDELSGGRGSDIIVGGVGNDKLRGGSDAGVDAEFDGRDILIGGIGQDDLSADKGDDLLIGGFTAYDLNAVALELLHREWTSARTYESRVSNMRVGTGDILSGSGVVLKASGAGKTVFDDNAQDKLNGGSGRDWYFADFGNDDKKRDKLSGQKGDELIELVF